MLHPRALSALASHVLAAALVAACSIHHESPEAKVLEVAGTSSASVAPTPGESAAAATLLVWARDAETGEASTYRVDDAGNVLDRTPGIRIAARGTEWSWTTAPVTVPTEACEDDRGGVREPPGEGSSVRATLAPVGPSAAAPQVLVEGRAATEAANALTRRVTVVASLGPLLFVEDETYVYACGAHGFTTKSFFVWDVERGAVVDANVLGDAAPALAKGRIALREADEDPGGADFGDGPEVTEIVPVFHEGRVSFEAQVTAAACYACGDGRWSSYTRSVRVPATPTATLATHAAASPTLAALAAFARRHPEVRVGGLSTPAREGGRAVPTGS